MESPEYKPVGGVAAVALYPPDEVTDITFGDGTCSASFGDEAVEVPLIDDRSTFEELFDNSSGLVSVKHTLTLVAERNLAGEWLCTDFLQRLARSGVIARVTLNDGRCLLVGYSARMEGDLPLRLVALHSDSGCSLSDTPTLTLTLRSQDVSPAVPIAPADTQ